MWEELKIVHGKPRYSQSQGSVERANQDIQNILATWLADNNSRKWSEGLKFVQFMKNRSFHHGTKRSPYEAMFGTHAKVGLKSTQIPTDLNSTLKSEEDLEKALVCGINIENINEKHEKSDGNDKDNANNFFLMKMKMIK